MVYVIKASGEKENFNKKKIERTVLKARGSRQFAKRIAKKIEKKIYNGITTKEILRITLSLLKEKPRVAFRYDLKRAIMSLGPSGFPFEKFFASILKNYEYKTEVGKFVRGKVIKHEIDVIARKEFNYMIECKYHNFPGIYTELKTALYTYARFLDIKNNGFDFPWLVTNTKCSLDAINYSKGVNMKITTWNYPKSESLQKLIEKKQLYPITILNSVKGDVKERLSFLGITIAKDILTYNFEELKFKTGFSEKVLNKIVNESKEVCL